VERADAGDWAPASLLILAGTLAGAGDAEAGVRVLHWASGAHPTDPWVYYMLGGLLGRVTPPRPEEAIEAYAAARALLPELGHELGHALERSRRSEEAEAVFRDLVARRPENARHLGCLGGHLKARGRSAEAEPFLERAIAASRREIDLEPNLAQAHIILGRALRDQGQPDEAIAACRRAIEVDPKDASAHNNLGLALRDQGPLDEAIAAYRRAIELDPKFTAAYSNLGVALKAKGQLEEAIAEYRRAIELDPMLAAAHKNLGIALREKGQLGEAIAAFREAARSQPGNSELLNELAWFLLTVPEARLRKEGEALDLARKAVALAPNDANLVNTLALAEYRTGNLDTCIAASDRATRLRQGGNANDWFVLAMAHAQKGETETARTWFDKAAAWAHEKAPRDADLRALWSEAAELLGRQGPIANETPSTSVSQGKP
jgi:superkiller protein 3